VRAAATISPSSFWKIKPFKELNNMDKYTGKRLDGRYEIHEVIGVGGMAVVYRAYDIIDDRTVAVKILKDEFSGNAEFLRRFRNESKAIAVLSHPNIVKVFDVSIGDRIQYIVEEYIDGITLKDYLDQQKQIKWKEAIHFTVQILRALQHAHGKGIVHRDIKPQNIMLLQDGTIKVTDFGIARFSHNETRTMTDKAIGSVHYIAPEQARGDFTDEKTDIYSVGVMLYEMLTGQLPFEADNAVSVAIMQLQTDPKPLREINPSIPEGLEEITLKAMQKDPARRYQSAADMLRDIEEFRRNPSARFQYQYFIDEKPTKYIDAIDTVKGPEPPYYNDNYEYVEEAGRVPAKKKKPVAVFVIAGIAAAFLIAAIALGAAALLRGWNSGPSDIVMPDFVGKNYNDVVNASTSSYSFEFKREDKSDSEHPAGIVISQTPKAGMTVKSNASVTLVVSTGGEKVSVPDVTGQTQDEAIAALADQGLNYKIYTVADDKVPSGSVVSTDPAANTQVAKGSEVKVYVSSGKLEQKVTVPDVAGNTLAEATAKITGVGLTVGEKTYKDDTGKAKDVVLSTDPLNGSKLEKGSTVNLVLSSGKTSAKSVDVFVDLPAGVTKDLVLKAYLDGSLSVTKTVNSSYNPTAQLTFSNQTGKHTLIVTLDDKKYRVYTLDFDAGKPKLENSYEFQVSSSSTPSSRASSSPSSRD
jgi:serine/threonine-protein kinase